MKLRHVIGLAGLAYVAYQAYQNREAIKSSLLETKETVDQMTTDVDDIKANGQIIQEQLKQLSKMSNDLSHKIRYFQKEAEAHLAQMPLVSSSDSEK